MKMSASAICLAVIWTAVTWAEPDCYLVTKVDEKYISKTKVPLHPGSEKKINLEAIRVDGTSSMLVCSYNNRNVTVASFSANKETVVCSGVTDLFKLEPAFIDASCGSDCWKSKKTILSHHVGNFQISTKGRLRDLLYRCELTFRDKINMKLHEASRFRRIWVGFVAAFGIFLIYPIGILLWEALRLNQ